MKADEFKDVIILLGSKSDWQFVKDAYETLRQFEVGVTVRVISAHRTPQLLDNFLNKIRDSQVKVIIACAGGAAHLPGVVAAKTILPVIGVPCKSAISIEGIDSLLSIVQMPPGVPVATVGINAAKNAALLAISILAIYDASLRKKLISYREEIAKKVMKDDEELNRELHGT